MFMKKYLGTKLVTAKPMTREEAEANLGKFYWPGDPGDGYFVCYENGFRAWVPKERFEKTYKPADNTLERMKIERDDLQKRLTSLTSALMQEGFQEKVGSKLYYLMQEQRNAMEIYAEVLSKQISYLIYNKCTLNLY